VVADPIEVFERLVQRPGHADRLRHLERLPARDPVYAAWPL